MLSFSVINNAQQVNEVNYAIQQLANSGDPVLQQQAVELNRFVDDANPNLMANPTLCIDENGITTIDGDVPEVVKVKMGLMDQLYSQHPDFENIRIIRIVIEDISDLNKLINLKNLIYFPNLKYIYFLSLFEVCPNNPENVVCQTSIFSKMVSGSEETSDIKVLFKVSSVW